MKTSLLKIAACAAAVCGVARSANADWTMAADKKSMTDGAWTVTTSTSKANGVWEITVSGISTLPDDKSVFDLRQPVADFTDGVPCVIVGMSATSFNGKDYPQTLRLPDTFRTFNANNLFMNNTGLTTIEPFFPSSLKNINSWVFKNASALAGDLVVSNAESAITFGTYLFENSKIVSAKLLDGVTASGSYVFSGSKQLKDVEFGPQLKTATSYTFNGCTGLTNVVFRGSAPDFENASASKQFAQSCTTLGFRYVVPKWDFTWEEYVDKSNAKTALTAAEIETYKGKYGEDGPLPEYKIKISALAANYGYDTFEYIVFRDDPLTSKGAVMVTTDSIRIPCVSPDYGVTRRKFGTGETVTLTAPASGVVSGIEYTCAGYKLEKLGADGWTTVGDVSSGTTCSYAAADDSSIKITWKWVLAGYALTIGDCGLSPADNTPLGSVDATPPDVGTKYSEGKRVTLKAIDGAGTFRRWCGADVPAGCETDREIEIEMSGPKSVYPYFEHAWVYANKTLKDGYWTLAASGDADAIVVGKPSVNWEGGYLDLSKPIQAGEDGGAFVEIVASFIASNGYVEELVLPENTIKKIGSNAFGNSNDKLKWVTPLLPDSVEEIGEGICRKARLLNNPTFAFRGGKKMGGLLHFESNNGTLKEIILGDGVRMIPDRAFEGVSGVTNVVIGCAVTNIGNNAFLSCSGVTSFTPFLPVGIRYLGTDALRKCGSTPNTTFVLDNGKDDIAFASQNLFFEAYDSISNMIVGAGVTALPDNFFKSGKRKLDEVMFKGKINRTTWKNNTFCTCEANKSRFVVSKYNDVWREWYENPANVKPWAECGNATNTYYQKWGTNAKRPVGLTISAPANVWIVPMRLPDEDPCSILMLR